MLPLEDRQRRRSKSTLLYDRKLERGQDQKGRRLADRVTWRTGAHRRGRQRWVMEMRNGWTVLTETTSFQGLGRQNAADWCAAFGLPIGQVSGVVSTPDEPRTSSRWRVALPAADSTAWMSSGAPPAAHRVPIAGIQQQRLQEWIDRPPRYGQTSWTGGTNS